MRAQTFLGLLALPLAGAFTAGGAALFRLPSVASTAPITPIAPPAPAVPPGTAELVSSLFRVAVRNADDALLALASPEAYWLLRQWRREVFGDLTATRDVLNSAKEQLLASDDPVMRGASVIVRTKGLFSTFHKAVVRKQRVHDVLAVRVVLRSGLENDACYDAHDVLCGLFGRGKSGRGKDYVANPKGNGYQAVHDTMILPSGLPMEIQIRTDDMHQKAEYGVRAPPSPRPCSPPPFG